MFCAFEGAARIMRLWGTGVAHEFGTPEYFALIPVEERLTGSRAAIVVDVHKVASVRPHLSLAEPRTWRLTYRTDSRVGGPCPCTRSSRTGPR